MKHKNVPHLKMPPLLLLPPHTHRFLKPTYCNEDNDDYSSTLDLVVLIFPSNSGSEISCNIPIIIIILSISLKLIGITRGISETPFGAGLAL